VGAADHVDRPGLDHRGHRSGHLGQRPVVYQETLVNDTFLEAAAHVERYTVAYNQLRAAGPSPADSVALMAEVKAALPD
jgi:hypothetical protein